MRLWNAFCKMVTQACRQEIHIRSTIHYDIYENGNPVRDPVRRAEIIRAMDDQWRSFDERMKQWR